MYVSTPIAVCEARDPKDLYRKARQGVIPNFTGVSDPYEVPEHPEITIDMSTLSIVEAVERVIHYLEKENYL